MIDFKIIAMCSPMLLLLATTGVPATDGQQKTTAVDPATVVALERMSAELRSHDAFVLRANVTQEDVLASGQKLQYGGTLEVKARRPDRFKISAVSDAKERRIYYDGTQVTIFAPRRSYYASFAAPGTIAETVKTARDDYGVEFPLADLFTWGVDTSREGRLTSAFLVRAERIGKNLCNHYALRQDKVDWQIWIAQEGGPLPCKIVITNTADASQPQYSAVLRWSFPSAIGDHTFAFAPPAGAKKIVVAKVGPD